MPAIGSIYFAAVGDVHGRLDEMVRMLSEWEKRTGNHLSFVLQAGDFEPHRDDAGTGSAAIPWPLHFIGGGHEPYELLDTMPDGGAIAPNISYMGRVRCMELEGCCVVGVSGIYGEERFYGTRPDPSVTRSSEGEIYFNEEDIGRALDYTSTDILILHEWPSGIIDPAHMPELEEQRRSLRYDRIGNDYARMLLDLLEPKLLICGHMHKSYRNTIELPSGEHARICALADIEHGSDAVAFFEVRDGCAITEVK